MADDAQQDQIPSPASPLAGQGSAPPIAPALATWQEKFATLRTAGATWDEIGDVIAPDVAKLRQAGATEDEIKQVYGFTDGQAATDALRSRAIQGLKTWTAPTTRDGFGMEAFKAGVEASSGGLLARKALPDMMLPTDAGFGARTAYMAGSLLGDLPAMVSGAMAGAGTAALTGGAAAPLIFGFAGALPAYVRAEYMQNLTKGHLTGPVDYAQRQAAVAWDTTKAGMVGAAMGVAGGLAGDASAAAGDAFLATVAKKSSAELAAMSGAQAVVEGRLPTWQDLTDGAVITLGMHIAALPSEMPGMARSVMSNLSQHFVDTGEMPVQAALRAKGDPELAQKLMAEKPPEPIPGSSETPVPNGWDIYDTSNQPSDAFVIPQDTPASTYDGPSLEQLNDPNFSLKDWLKEHDPAFAAAPEAAEAEPPSLAPTPGLALGVPHFEVPPDKPTDFEKGLSYLDHGNFHQPLRWSESKQKWLFSYQLTKADWKFQNSLHEPAVGEAGADVTSWWHGSAYQNPEMAPNGKGGSIKAVWFASDRGTSHIFSGGATQGSMTRAYILPGKYFDFRDPAHQKEIQTWLDDQEASGRLADLPDSQYIPDQTAAAYKAKMKDAHYTTMQTQVMQTFLKEKGYDGYFERENLADGTPVNLAVYNPDKIIRGEKTDLRTQLTRTQRYEKTSAAQPEDLARPGTVTSVYTHGDRPEEGTIHAAIGGDNGYKPPAPPPGTAVAPAEEEPANPFEAVAERIGTVAQPGWWQRVKNNLGELYRQFMRQEHPMLQLRDAVLRGGAIPDLKDPAFLYRLAENSDTLGSHMILRGMLNGKGERVGKSLAEIIAPFSKEVGADNFWTYSLSRWAMSEAVKGRETGVPLDPAMSVVAARHAKYAEAFNDLLDWNNGTLAYLRDKGRISDAQYDAMVDLGASGLPGFRVEPENAPEHAVPQTGGTGKGKQSAQTVFERLGSDMKIQHFVNSLAARAVARTRAGMNNEANLAAAKMAESIGMAKQVRTAALNMEANELLQIGMDAGGLHDTADTADEKRVLAKLGWDTPADMVTTWENGQPTQWRFWDQNVTRFIKGMDAQGMNILQKMLAPFGRFQRSMTVLNPLFTPKILLNYDLLFQFLTNPEARNTVSMALEGMRHVFDKTDTFDEAVRSGALNHVFASVRDDKFVQDLLAGKEDPAYAGSAWNKLNNPVASLKWWASSMSQVMPVGRFAQGVRQGESTTRAAAMATEAAFDRAGGGGPLSRNINIGQPFFKAYVTGLDRTFRAMTGVGGRTLSGAKQDPALFAARATVLVTFPFIKSYLDNRDKEWYKAAPDWQKNNGLLLHTGGDGPGEGTTWYLPYPPLIGMVFGGLPRMLLQAHVEQDTHALDHLTSDLAGMVAPPAGAFLYSVFTPLVEKIANWSFFRGAPLISDAMKQRLAVDQFTPWTTELAKGIATGVSKLPLVGPNALAPIQVDNFINQWSGTVGRFAIHAAEAGLRAAGAFKDVKPAENVSDWPGLSSFMSRYPSMSAQPILDFERRMTLNAQIHGSMSAALQQDDPDRFAELASQNPAETALHPFTTKVVPGALTNFLPSYQAAAQFAGQNKDDLISVLKADKLLQAMHLMTRYIDAIPNRESMSDAQKAVVLEARRATAAPGADVLGTGSMSANDKRQLLDSLYSQMQMVSERGLQYMNKLNMQ